jgi:hypothetical protein
MPLTTPIQARSRFIPINTSGEYAYVLRRGSRSEDWRCVATFRGPTAYEQAARRARELEQEGAR